MEPVALAEADPPRFLLPVCLGINGLDEVADVRQRSLSVTFRGDNDFNRHAATSV